MSRASKEENTVPSLSYHVGNFIEFLSYGLNVLVLSKDRLIVAIIHIFS